MLACVVGLWVANPEHGPFAVWTLTFPDILVLALGFLIGVGVDLRAVDRPRLSRSKPVLPGYAQNVLFGLAAVALFALLLDRPLLTSRAFLLSFGATLLACRLLVRFTSRILLVQLRARGRNLRNVVVIGSGERALQLARAIERNSHYGYHVVGHVDRELKHPELPRPYLGPTSSFQEILANTQIDEVFVALPVRTFYDDMREVVDVCAEQGIPVHIEAEFFSLSLANATMDELAGKPILTLVSSGPMKGIAYLMKRSFDFIGAMIILTVLSPLLIGIALAILVTMGRPIFHVAPRIGFRRKVFPCLKFRTMVRDADALQAELEAKNEAVGPNFKLKNDPRITPLGRWLRRYSLDEFPQLLNVARGEMSLVGPRPLPVRDVERFDHAAINRRFCVWPGLTCIWQISGRSELDFEEWLRLDLEYIEKWTLLLDLKILLLTIPAVLSARGAY